MIIQSMPYPRSPNSGGPQTYSKWRLSFPDGGPVSNPNEYINASEIEMFATGDEYGTDQCSGGTATASSSQFSGQTPAQLFDDTSSVWHCGQGQAVGAWVQYEMASARSIGSASVVFESRPAQKVDLQSFDGSSAATVRSFDTSSLSGSHDGGRRILLKENGWAEMAFKVNGGTAISTSAYAMKGQLFGTNTDIRIGRFTHYFRGNGNTYKAMILRLDFSTHELLEVMYESGVAAYANEEEIEWTLPNPIALAAGSKFAVVLIRSGGGDSAACSIAFPAGSGNDSGPVEAFGSVRLAIAEPTVGDTISGFGTSSTTHTSLGFEFGSLAV